MEMVGDSMMGTSGMAENEPIIIKEPSSVEELVKMVANIMVVRSGGRYNVTVQATVKPRTGQECEIREGQAESIGNPPEKK